MGVIYFVVMLGGAVGFRVTPSGWKPLGWSAPEHGRGKGMITRQNVHLSQAWKTPQFWLIWGLLCLNVTAGVGVISMASPMFQDVFGARLIGAHAVGEMTGAQKTAVAAAAAGLVGLISLFNAVGRIFWASLSDRIGRKNMFFTIFVLGIVLYCLLPTWGHLVMPALFVASICVILSMYGGGFATVPAYLADIFGPQMVGAIHGRLITAWSVAAVIGPSLIAGIREFELGHGVPHALLYDVTLYIMAVLLLGGLICNVFVKPVHSKHWMSADELATERALLHEDQVAITADTAARGAFGLGGILAWLAVGVPFCIGLFIAIEKAATLF
jgi:MFS family permease